MTHMDKRDGVDRSGIIRAREWEHNTEPPPLTEASLECTTLPVFRIPSSGTVAFRLFTYFPCKPRTRMDAKTHDAVMRDESSESVAPCAPSLRSIWISARGRNLSSDFHLLETGTYNDRLAEKARH